MAQSIINWTPGAGTNSLNQTVQYKLQSSETWITFSTVSAGIGTATITGLLDNRIYDFRVIDNCSAGGPTNSAVFSTIKIICPTLVVTPSYNNVQFSFSTGSGDISKCVVDIVNIVNDTIVESQTFTSPGSTVSGMFTTVSPSTDYQVKVTMFAGNTFGFTKVCTPTNVSTTAEPVCAAPTLVTATLS